MATTLYWEEQFDRDNATGWGASPDQGWSSSEWLGLVDGAIIPIDDAATHYIARASSGGTHTDVDSEYVLTATVAANVASGQTQTFNLVARAEGSNITTATENRYLVELILDNDGGTESGTLAIKKEDSGGTTTLVSATTVTTELNTSSDSFVNVFQHMAMRIRDDADGVIIEAYLNDEERPRLTIEDNKYPSINTAGFVGISMAASSASLHIGRIGSFAIHAIADAVESEQPVPNFFTFNKLVEITRARALRDSSSLVDSEFFKDLLNEAQFELCNYVGRPYWLEDVHQFSTRADGADVELPSDTLFTDDVVWDTSSSVPIPIISEQQFRREEGRTSSGVPTAFRLTGTGPEGGPLLKSYPSSSSSKNYEIRRFRMPRYMTDGGDLPDVPQPFAYALIWGALTSYTMRDSDRTHIQSAAAKWQTWLRRIRNICRRRDSLSSKAAISSGFSGVGLGNTLWVQGRYGGWRWRG